MTRILEERRFPVDQFVPLASERSGGRLVTFDGAEHEVRELTVDAARGVDVAFVSAGGSISKAFLPDIAAAGAVCIDNSSAFRMDPDVPLSVPEVNPEALEGVAAPRHHRGAELHDDPRRAAPGASASSGRVHVARALELPGRERCRVEGHP